MATQNQKPLHHIKVASAQVTIWEHHTDKGNPFLTATVSRSYKDKEGNWQTAHSFSIEQLDSAIDAMIDAKEFMREHRRAASKAA